MSTRPPRAASAARSDQAGVFSRIAGFANRHRWTALILWLVVLVGVWAGASQAGDRYRDDYSLPGTETQNALEILKEHGAGNAWNTVSIVLHDKDGLRTPGTESAVAGMLKKVSGLSGVVRVQSPYKDRSAISADGTVGYATVELDRPAENVPLTQSKPILDTAREIQKDGLQVELGGEAARKLGKNQGSGAEGAGVFAALAILLFMFGTVIAASLPVITAVFAVGATLGIIVLASHKFIIASYSPYVMALVGLGVGIDYALLIFARYRAELVKDIAPDEAERRALEGAGRTVLFAGCTVIIALLGLVALGLGSLRGMALAVALTVLLTMVASLTLLPSLLAIFGKRFARQFTARARKRAAKGRPEEGTRWRAWGEAVQRRPWTALLLPLVALGALAVPAADLRLGLADAGNDPDGTTSRVAYDLLAKGFGPGFNGPLVIVTEGDDAVRAAGAAAGTLKNTPGIALVNGPIPTEDGKAAMLLAVPKTAPQDTATTDLVHRLRDDVLPGLAKQTKAEYLVGGATAAVIDFSETIGGKLPLFVTIVIGLSIVLLTMVFRSVLIPLKAALLNLVSVGAALGAVSLVFQHGWLGADPGPIEAFIPTMIFAIVFGLSMDYEIFLVSRMREEWLRSKDAAKAVREGLAHTGAVVTAAGAVMIVVFGAFMLSPDRMLRQFGFGLAVAIFVDAVLIRCLIVPAAMRLMGKKAWWLPQALGRVLPEVRVEKH
ncbi:membrane protein [Streptomyces sp. NRRL WC-3618]|uniref:MMPL family transporter n=1 Tax=Streptomyces sp. NRRL WC-3618 TaxID=1519490 RepID=UPI0006ADE953|nr:MMPL family transporter [Streptomyces sp. NRRL WC-3618]KOV60924.1 membrane protein [Streptomyces sp. NRRL WC-3618]